MPDHNRQHKNTIIETLADTYRQLYVAPQPGGREKYSAIVGEGRDPETHDLSHFITSDEDSLTVEETPAGSVTVITLGMREDFVTFIRIMAKRCELADIPDTQGASTLDGVINWRKIERHREEYTASDWDEEFRRFTSDRNNFKDVLIVLSVGPYSAIPATRLDIPADEWITLSGKIRRFHECTHFICRKLYPDKIDAVWDELVADAVGIYGAFGRFDAGMEKMFLGIEGNTYTGGRLENYTEVDAALTDRICGILDRFADTVKENAGLTPYELAIWLEETKEDLWDTAVEI